MMSVLVLIISLFPFFVYSGMDVNVGDLRALIDALHEKTKEPRTSQGLDNIRESIGRKKLGERYLYKSIVNPIEKLGEADVLGLHLSPLDEIAKYLGYRNFGAFCEARLVRPNPQLDSLVGIYYSYIRMNVQETVVLRSPVRIFVHDDKFQFEQQGKRNLFQGELKVTNGCLFVLLNSDEEKSFYHIYKIGTITNPKVLQGIFSGVSSAFDPIGGRVLLVKTEGEFKDLEIAEMIPSALPSKNSETKTLLKYLNDFEKNNLRINPPTSYTVRDLTI